MFNMPCQQAQSLLAQKGEKQRTKQGMECEYQTQVVKLINWLSRDRKRTIYRLCMLALDYIPHFHDFF